MEELLFGLSYLFNNKADSRIAAEVFISASLNFSNEAVIWFFLNRRSRNCCPKKVLTSRACHSLVQWEGSGFPYCKVRERAGGGEKSCNKSSHTISPTWQYTKRRKRSCRRKSRAAGLRAGGRSGRGYNKSFIPQLFPGSQTALCIYLGISKLLHAVGNTQSEGSKIHTTIPQLASANLNTQKDLEVYHFRDVDFNRNPAFSLQHCRIRNTVTIASYLVILLGTSPGQKKILQKLCLI